jgi:hypothetical protein
VRGAVLGRLSAVEGVMQALVRDQLMKHRHARTGGSPTDQEVAPAQLRHCPN